MMSDEDDVPIRVDFRDAATCRTWIEDTRIKRPYRPRFFAAFCAALASRPSLRILELGSGPGQLAREILVHCDVHAYVALDFSPAMHEIAAEHLGDLASRVAFVTRGFREPSWPHDLGMFDAVVTLQAAHETRHKRHLVPLLERARTVIVPGGVLLYADHYMTPEMTLRALATARDDQPTALERAGFVDVELRYEEGNMALWCGMNRMQRQLGTDSDTAMPAVGRVQLVEGTVTACRRTPRATPQGRASSSSSSLPRRDGPSCDRDRPSSRRAPAGRSARTRRSDP